MLFQFLVNDFLLYFTGQESSHFFINFNENISLNIYALSDEKHSISSILISVKPIWRYKTNVKLV